MCNASCDGCSDCSIPASWCQDCGAEPGVTEHAFSCGTRMDYPAFEINWETGAVALVGKEVE